MSFTLWLTIGWSRCANSSSLLSMSTLLSSECRSPWRPCADVTSSSSSSSISETVTRWSCVDMSRHVTSTRPDITSRHVTCWQLRRRRRRHDIQITAAQQSDTQTTADSLHSNSTQPRSIHTTRVEYTAYICQIGYNRFTDGTDWAQNLRLDESDNKIRVALSVDADEANSQSHCYNSSLTACATNTNDV